jgi:hypothetical protein
MNDKQMSVAYYQEDLETIEKMILPGLRSRLDTLTGPDYKPEMNPFHETRDEDVAYLKSRIEKNENLAAFYRRMIQQAGAE